MLRAFILIALLSPASPLVLTAHADPVGERHLVTTNSTAALRDAEHRAEVRATIWYPAAADSIEQRIDIGPPGRPLFRVAAVSPEAALKDADRRPVILFSHGFGGTARMMGWFGVPLARAGYIVIAVDHPGNNGLDEMTVGGAVLFWNRVEDLRAALGAVQSDPVLGAHIDPNRVGIAGFSAGGFTALVAAGARVELDRLFEFCGEHPTDGVCVPQAEFALSLDEIKQALASPEFAAETAHAGDDHTMPEVRAALVIAPAIVQALQPTALAKITRPLAIILGDADPVASPETNGLEVARLLPTAELKTLPQVGHYDFLSTCTPAGIASVPFCAVAVPQEETHQTAIEFAIRFFDQALEPR